MWKLWNRCRYLGYATFAFNRLYYRYSCRDYGVGVDVYIMLYSYFGGLWNICRCQYHVAGIILEIMEQVYELLYGTDYLGKAIADVMNVIL